MHRSAGREVRRARFSMPQQIPEDPENLAERAARLVDLASQRRRALILTHDNPDPDSMAAALALAQIFDQRAKLASTIAYGGIIGRAENRAMIRTLRIPIVPLQRIDAD